MNPSVRWIETQDDWERARAGWDELVLACADPSIFLTWDFLDACWVHFARPSGQRLAVMELVDGARRVGLAPLRLVSERRYGLSRRRLAHLAGWEYDRPGFCLPREGEDECLRAIAAALDRRHASWDAVDLKEVPEGSPLLNQLRAWAASAGHEVEEQDAEPSPWVDLSSGWAAARGAMGASTRRTLDRYMRRLHDPGEVALEIFAEADRMEEAIDRYLDLETRGWKHAAGQGIGKHARQEAFYRDLLPRLARAGRVSVGFLRQGQRVLAGRIDLRLGDVVWWAQGAYADLPQLSPGNLLQMLMLERHAQQGVRRCELQGRFLGNKQRFTPLAHANRDLRILQRRGLKRRLLWATRRFRPMLG